MIPLVLRTTDPCFNLAFEERLCRTLPRDHPGWLLFWSNRASVIVGRFQSTVGEINADFLRNHNIQVVRRMTGGGAVYHDEGNINYSFIVPRSSESRPAMGFEVYQLPIVQALRNFGLDASTAGRNDILVSGAKCSGSAQHVMRHVLLHHGTLLYDLDIARLEQALTVDPGKYRSKGHASVRSRVTNLKPLLPAGITKEDMMLAIASKCTGFGEILEAAVELPEDMDAAQCLAEKKYRTWEWNFGRSPDFNETRSRRFSWGRVDALFDVRRGEIVSCTFQGDFFSGSDPALIAKRLEHVPFKTDAIYHALETAPLETCFTGCDAGELRAFIAGD